MIPTLVLAVSAHAADVDFTCSPDEGGGIVGLPPLEVRCVVVTPAEGTWESTSWTFGEGTLLTGDAVSFVYEDEGQYTVSVQLDGYEGLDTATDDPYHAEFGYVTVCGAPEVRFTYVNKGGLDYELVNKTVVAVNCIQDLQWEVFEGKSAEGEPKYVFETWSPRFELPREGPWTIRLTVGGLAGTSAADLTIDAKKQLTDDLTQGPHAYWCATSPSAGAPWMWVAGLVVLRRRKR